MGRFILRYRGPGQKPAEDVARVRELSEVRVLDDSSPRMLLVEAPAEAKGTLADALPGWLVSEEKTYRIPDPRPRPRKE